MEKILLVESFFNPGSGAIDFASYLATLTNSRITGIFLDINDDENKFVAYEPTRAATNAWPLDQSVPLHMGVSNTVNDRVTAFKASCERRSNRYSIHLDNGNPAKEIIHESRYADVLIVDAETRLKKYPDQIPSVFLAHLLSEVECPVFIAPQSFEGTEQIIFTYDGSKACMHAIKHFCYLFPELDDKKVTVVQVANGVGSTAEEHNHLREWLSTHYNSIGFTFLKGDDVETTLVSYLLKQDNAMIVMGAYGKKLATSMYRRSHAENVIKCINQPIFIAHP